MESSVEKLELIDQAIQKLLAAKRNKQSSTSSEIDDDEYHQLLSTLLSQCESLKEDGAAFNQKDSENCSARGEEESKDEKANKENCERKEVVAEEIVKELGEVRRQNFITHCLLSAMIVLTVAWQVSEVSLILKVKDGVTHPFRSLGSMLIGLLKGPEEDSKKHKEEGLSTLPLRMPELPRMDGGFNGENHM